MTIELKECDHFNLIQGNICSKCGEDFRSREEILQDNIDARVDQQLGD